MGKRSTATKKVHVDKYDDKAKDAQVERKNLDGRVARAAEVARKQREKEWMAKFTNYCKQCGLPGWECDMHDDHPFQPLTKKEMTQREADLEAAVGREMYNIAFFDPRKDDGPDETVVQLLHAIFEGEKSSN